MLTQQIKESINKSVLCWLATASLDGMPNVSPKEIFTSYDHQHVIIANIASPQSIQNIKHNPQVCISFIDILVQRGWQLKGKAVLIEHNDSAFALLKPPLLKMTEGKFPFSTIIKIKIQEAKPIWAPSYIFYPEITQQEQIENALKRYNLKK